MRCRPLVFACLALTGLPGVSRAAVPPADMPAFLAEPAAAPAPRLRLAERLAAAPARSLRAAAEGARDQLDALTAWNQGGHLPVRTGFSRPLPSPIAVRLSADASGGATPDGLVARAAGGDLVWGTHVRVAGAHRLRLRLSGLDLPEGTRFWIHGAGEEPRAFGLGLAAADGTLWTPSVGGESAFLEVEVPAAAAGRPARFTVAEVSESFRLDRQGAPVLGFSLEERIGECIVDATCIGATVLDVVAGARRAVALLQFIDGGGEFLCSGGLINDTDDSTFVPLLLTANHCISTQASAATVEAFWDYHTNSCGGSAPNLSTRPRSNGSTLLASAAASDFTLLRLSGIPGNRFFLGWDERASAASNGRRLHRISHPFGRPASYSMSTVRTSGVPFCGDAPRPRFLYHRVEQGGTFGGSSGAPVFLSGGFIVGQLSGGCGATAEDGCDYSNSEIDGAFAASFAALQPFLDPAPAPTVCTEDADTMCLNGGRFAVEAEWQTAADAGQAAAVRLTGDTGYLWFFDDDNVEVVVKVIDACALNNRFWVFAGGLTNVRVALTVTDVQTGARRHYTNPLDTTYLPVQDTDAFATCP